MIKKHYTVGHASKVVNILFLRNLGLLFSCKERIVIAKMFLCTCTCTSTCHMVYTSQKIFKYHAIHVPLSVYNVYVHVRCTKVELTWG